MRRSWFIACLMRPRLRPSLVTCQFFFSRIRPSIQCNRGTAGRRGKGFCSVFGRVLPSRWESAPEPWTKLFRIACRHFRQANSQELVIDEWTFGGATAMMLQINHRESRDIDIFLPDPQ